MVSREKVECMTQVAMLWKKGNGREAEVCKYCRKDYIALHMFGVWVSSSAAYLLLTAALLIFIFGKNPDQYLSFETVGKVTILWGLAYLIFCLIFGWIAWMCYSARYRKAKSWQRKYHYALHALEKRYCVPAEAEFDDGWQVGTVEGTIKKL